MCSRASAWGAAWGAVDMSVLGRLGALRTRCLFRLMTSRIGEKLPVMNLNLFPYEDQQEEKAKPIGRYPVPYVKDLPFDIVELMDEIEKQVGFLPNIFKVLSHRPSEFRAFFAYYNAIYNKETGQLSKADKELIIVVTSLAGKCLYNVVVHSALHRVYSKDPVLSDQVCINWRKSDLPAREKAMLEFALAVTQVEEITDDHFTKLQVHGFSREDAWDIATIAAFYAMANRLAHFISIVPNREFYTVGRTSSDNNKKNELDAPQA